MSLCVKHFGFQTSSFYLIEEMEKAGLWALSCSPTGSSRSSVSEQIITNYKMYVVRILSIIQFLATKCVSLIVLI